jgi:hypothetical protein
MRKANLQLQIQSLLYVLVLAVGLGIFYQTFYADKTVHALDVSAQSLDFSLAQVVESGGLDVISSPSADMAINGEVKQYWLGEAANIYVIHSSAAEDILVVGDKTHHSVGENVPIYGKVNYFSAANFEKDYGLNFTHFAEEYSRPKKYISLN